MIGYIKKVRTRKIERNVYCNIPLIAIVSLLHCIIYISHINHKEV